MHLTKCCNIPYIPVIYLSLLTRTYSKTVDSVRDKDPHESSVNNIKFISKCNVAQYCNPFDSNIVVSEWVFGGVAFQY